MSDWPTIARLMDAQSRISVEMLRRQFGLGTREIGDAILMLDARGWRCNTGFRYWYLPPAEAPDRAVPALER